MEVNELITWPTLCVFGNSIVVGSDDREAGGWVARLRLDLNARGKIGVYNLGVDGDRTEQLLQRLAGEAAARNASVIVISIGANDLGWHGTSGTDIALFRERYDHILSEAEQFTRRILMLGLLNVDEGNDSHGVRNDQVRAFNGVVEELARRHGAEFMSLYGLLSPTDFVDGLHPNASGHAKLAPLIGQELARLGWDE
ncbi:MAG TPA: GDSL-type esterase/lipase family protein [Gaiellaceae bacterium]|jgi:lysophospholipase L1-like esterase